MYRSLFPHDMLAALDRIQREMSQSLEFSPNIRGLSQSAFPALNLGSTAQTFEVYAFAPGIDPQSIDVQLEKGVLAISGERICEFPEDKPADDKTVNGKNRSMVHINERFSGRFRRVISLPDDIDPEQITARYQDGVLQISVARRSETLPRRITVA